MNSILKLLIYTLVWVIKAGALTLSIVDQVLDLPPIRERMSRLQDHSPVWTLILIIISFLLLFPIWIPLSIVFGFLGLSIGIINVVMRLNNTEPKIISLRQN